VAKSAEAGAAQDLHTSPRKSGRPARKRAGDTPDDTSTYLGALL
jgi:hypothetical protein